MKNLITLVLSLFIVIQSFATDWTNIRSEYPRPAEKELIYSNIESSEIRFSLNGFRSQTVTTTLGAAVIISLDKATPILEQGAPDLPKMTASVIIPDLARMKTEVIDASYRDYENFLIAPSKGNLTRDIDPATVPYEFGAVYQQNAFFPGNLVDMREPYIMRDHRGQTVIIYPFQYNPVTKTLRVYTDITVRISRMNDTGENPLLRAQEPDVIDAQFNHLYNRHFLNSGSASRYTPVSEFGNILIISYGAFMNAMEPYVLWRKQMGYPVEMVDVGSIGNAAAIKSYIANYYNTKGLTFVLLVGDAAQVPTSSTSAGHSDVNYSYVVGNDHYPDLFVGRFSAENIDHVNTQVQRTLHYEQNPPTDVDWFTICTGIASNQGPGDDGEYDYQHIRNIQNNKLIPFTYTYGNELYDGSQGGNDASGNPTPAMVANDVNNGTGIINYCGHGSNTAWSTSGFSNSDVNNLVNTNMLPFIWSVACVNGNFVNMTCFAEAWLRATHDGQPTGAIAFLGSTINQSWNPPMAGQDEMNDILVETYQNNINRTFGALSMHGCMLMNDEFGSGGYEMTDTWTCFGDPSVMVRTAVPQAMTVTHDPILFIGATQMTIVCDAEGGRASLSLDGTLLCTEIIQGSSVTLNFTALNNPGSVTLTITAFNYLPYITEIDVIPATGPYVVMDSYQVSDPTGNNNGLPDYNETIHLDMNMKNVGVLDAINVMVSLSTNDPYIIVSDYSELFEIIPAGETVNIAEAFTFFIASDVPDQHQVIFNLTSDDGTDSWQSTFFMNMNAPVLNINSITVNDNIVGNGNGELDPGERAELTINYSNTGHAVAYDVDVYLEGRSGFVEISDPLQHFNSIGFFGAFNKTFSVSVDDDAPTGITVDFFNELTMGDHHQDKNFPLKISANCEDFETNNFTKFNWQQGGNLPWQISNVYPYQGFYSARSGVITHNETSELWITYEVMSNDSIVFIRKVSSESSDYLKFYINNELMGQWSGTTGGWKREAFPVSGGMKTFKWVYQKNNVGSAGNDCAWLDYIVFPSPKVLTIWAGPDDEVCEGESYHISKSYGTAYFQAEWATSGSGAFNNNTIINPVYTPSGADISGGEVQLTLTLWGSQGSMVTDEMKLGFIVAPAAPATPEGPDYIDVAVTQVSEYLINAIAGAVDYIWALEPEIAGTIIAQDTNATVSWNAEFTGTAHIMAAALNECGTGPFSAALEVTVDNTLVYIADPGAEGVFVKIYPNPTSGLLHLAWSDASVQNRSVRIYGLAGNIVYNQENAHSADGQVMTIDVSALSPGVYVMALTGNGSSLFQKLIIR
ncbi:MAG: T9SS type A sorting domain-containing protein [Bacteroidales bacterium]|nr:T9SS type A sorting domain-containing protein [Bacteroidales bacterium]